MDQSCRLRGGDLLAIDPRLPHDVLEPRTVRFVTDSWGFPNDRDYHGQRLLLAGDSFVQGSGCDVRESLASVLREEHGLDTYSVAHPGVPDLYLQSIAWVSRQPAAVSRQPRALLFVFEGNDFAPVDGPWPRPMPRPSRYDWYKVRVMAGAGRDLASPRLLFAASRLAVAMLVPSSVVAVEVHRVGSSPVGFLGRYVDAARARRLWMPLLDSSSLSALARVAAVFFVPTKYRVYAPLLDDRPAALPDPPPGLRDLQRFFGALRTPVVDLTPVLRASARKLQTEGKYVYWRDDTHWNPLGIRAAARVVAQTVRRVVAEGEEGVRRGSGAVADAPSATGRSGASSRGASTPAE